MTYSFLNFHPTASKIPYHVGIIPDGTRRWAKKQGIPLIDAYKLAMNKISEYMEYIFSESTEIISIYFASVQNFSRSESDVSAFCYAEAYFCSDVLPEICDLYDTRVQIVGNRDIIPDYYLAAIQRIEQYTRDNTTTKLYLCVAYNPLEEIEHAFSIAKEDELFLKHLWVKEPLDMVIRTDANLLSNFLPLQAGFARLYFIDKLFDETTMDDIEKIFEAFKSIKRVYGT